MKLFTTETHVGFHNLEDEEMLDFAAEGAVELPEGGYNNMALPIDVAKRLCRDSEGSEHSRIADCLMVFGWSGWYNWEDLP